MDTALTVHIANLYSKDRLHICFSEQMTFHSKQDYNQNNMKKIRLVIMHTLRFVFMSISFENKTNRPIL